jgi:MscS family membrane protein
MTLLHKAKRGCVLGPGRRRGNPHDSPARAPRDSEPTMTRCVVRAPRRSGPSGRCRGGHAHRLRGLARLGVTLVALVLPLTPLDAGAESVEVREPASVVVSERSPRAAMAAFSSEARRGRFDLAARFIEAPRGREAERETLAFHIKVVLDRSLWIDPETLSPKAEGNLDDGLLPRLEQIGRIDQGRYASLPIRLSRADDADPVGWRFSRTSVAALDALYESMPERVVLERVPATLRAMGPFGLMWWQWLALPTLGLTCGLLGLSLGYLSRRVLSRLSKHTQTNWDDALVARARGPLSLLWGIAMGYLAMPYLVLPWSAEQALETSLKTLSIVAVFWAALRSIDLSADLMVQSAALRGRSARALLVVVTRIAKVVVLAMLVIAVLSGFGLPVASLLAGLGVGGIALALAAQKTVENVFGAISIGADAPFQVGDFVKVGDVLGTVETIGLRSTRLRTQDRTLITIPNGGLADTRIESFTARDRMRLATTLGLEYGTSQAQLRAILQEIEATLRAHPRIFTETVIVRFVRFGASSLDIEVMAWFLTQDFQRFQGFRQDVLLDIMQIVERSGASFAFPTQTIHLRERPQASSGTAS